MSAIELRGLTKRYGAVRAVDGLTLQLSPGRMTGFIGANGAGKTTTMRLLLGLAHAGSGEALVEGKRYGELEHPLRHVGALLDPNVFHPRRSGRDALRVIARAAALDESRVDLLLETVDLTHAADRKVGGYSVGMRQRLGLAAALLGDPGILVLDEPANGLDPQGVHWLRGLLRSLAAEGRTLFVSSHLLAELAQSIDDVVVIDKGRLLLQQPMAQLLDEAAGRSLEETYLELVTSGGRPGAEESLS